MNEMNIDLTWPLVFIIALIGMFLFQNLGNHMLDDKIFYTSNDWCFYKRTIPSFGFYFCGFFGYHVIDELKH